PTAKGYLDETMFRRHGIRLEYKSYRYPDYPQQFGTFIGSVTVLDLIANTGTEAGRYLRSLEPNEVAIP
ncbi:MAG TPA: WbqC family protein, partial [Thermoanaerobaculia bacterium]